MACVGLTVAGFLLYNSLFREPAVLPSEAVRRARLALSAGNFKEAEELALTVPDSHGTRIKALLIAGEAATKDGRLDDAADHYRLISPGATEDAIVARFCLGEVLLHAGNLSAAEKAYREVVKYEQGHVEAYSRLAYVLGLTGRRRESSVYLFAILRSGAASLDELVLLADPDRPVDEGELLKEWAAQHPEDDLVQLGLATHLANDGQADRAIEVLQPIVERRPELEAAQCLFGELLIESMPARFPAWHAKLPDESRNWPHLWFVRGRWAQKAEQLETAVFCFLQTIKRLPLHRRASYELGITLARLNHPAAETFSEQAEQLLGLSSWLPHVRESEGTDEKAFRNVVEILEDQARVWEACAWANVAKQIYGDKDWVMSRLDKLAPMLSPDLPLIAERRDLVKLVDTSQYPPFKVDVTEVASTSNTSSGDAVIRFAAESSALPKFVYFNGNDESTPGARIQEQTGGGASVVDVDNDTWPDLYFVQGGDWAHGAVAFEESDRFSDRLFRNRGGVKFTDITAQSGIDEGGFGQCCAAGDINNDGFPDLYIANIGANTLYLNCGDGTFQKMADGSNFEAPVFSSSAVIADLNGDGWSDIFDANYVTGAEVYELICSGHACSPAAFEGEPDKVHLSDGQGGFVTLSPETPVEDSKGLGAIAVRMDDPLRPSVFVANDQTPNFLLALQDADENSPATVVDAAHSSGIAFSQDGLLTAAMGIAADDIDHNGTIDFFVTNFQDESNCLYVQASPGFFTDTARRAGLRSPSYSFVGWGTQFLDADLNGEMDLVIANGHVDSYFEDGVESRMRCQLFQNTGEARFTEVRAEDAGEFFDRKYYGRSLAKLDWNRDGRTDFVMSPIRDPAVLVTNQSSDCGGHVNVRLHATETARDAFFTVVEVVADTRVWSKQLVAGGGYHAANEQQLQFGIGAVRSVQQVNIRWPSGGLTQIMDVPAGSSLDVTEGKNFATVWRQGHGGRLNAEWTAVP